MMKHLLILVSTLIASNASAMSPGVRIINETAVLENIVIAPTNPGINPSFEALDISARVMVGANACSAQGLTARLVAQPDFDGNYQVVAIVSGRQPAGLACPLNYDPVYTTVNTTIRDQKDLLSATFLHNAFERDLTVSAGRFVQCDEPVRCTREYDPQSCHYDGVTFEGGNFCMTEAKAKTFACVKGIAFDPEEMMCSRIGE